MIIAGQHGPSALLIVLSVISIIVAFVAGSMPFGYLVVKLFFGKDVREYGSRNIGMTNVWRSFGKTAGITVFILDFAKGFLPTLWGVTLSHARLGWPHLPMACGAAAVVGHSFTPWLRFRGGKGIAAGAGVLVALFQWWCLVPLGAFVLILAATRMVSASSMTAGVVAAVTAFLVADLRPYEWVMAAFALFTFWTHRENIRRIIAGTESRIGGRKPNADA
jgi:glycerol-3-phosphate acyltransferase PlsY